MNSLFLKYEQFIEYVLAKVPQLRAVHSEHLKDNDELLPHVFMGDVTRFLFLTFENRKRRDHTMPKMEKKWRERYW